MGDKNTNFSFLLAILHSQDRDILFAGSFGRPGSGSDALGRLEQVDGTVAIREQGALDAEGLQQLHLKNKEMNQTSRLWY